MTDNHCPHTMQIGSQEARISALEKNYAELETSMEVKINSLTLTVQSNALKIIEEKANQSGFIKGIHATATLLGYSIIIIGLLLAGKFTGAIESALKFFAGFK